MKQLNFQYEVPSAGEYLRLRESVGWGCPAREAVEKGLANSCYFLTVRDKGTLIGMGRIIGDGYFTFHIVDIIVIPDYQGKGIGKQIMTNVMEYIRNHGDPGSYITLNAAKGREPFYEQFGFFRRPTDLLGHGMMMKLGDQPILMS